MVNKQSTDLADYIGHIMVVDDDNITLKNVRRILEKEGHRVSTYNNPVRALKTLEENCFDILLSDLSMPYLDGLELLEQAKRVHQDLEVIIITGFASLDKAVEATKKGAYHFLAKPFEPAQLREVVNQAIDQKRRRNMARTISTNDEPDPDAPLIIGQSPQMIRVAETIAQVAPTDCNILLSGESGTGQGAGGQGHPCPKQPQQRPHGGVQLRVVEPGADGKRAVRPRKRRLHGSGRHQGRPVGDGPRRHGLFG